MLGFGKLKKYWSEQIGRSMHKDYLADPDDPNANVSPIRRYIQSGYKSVFNARENRGETVQEMPYEEMLKIWGVKPEEVEMVVSRMRMETKVFAVVMAVSVLYLFFGEGFFNTLSSLIIFVTSLLVCSTRLWRVNCLENEEYTPYVRYIRESLW